jgi:glycerol-3-phosphate acyltransferase PlsY
MIHVLLILCLLFISFFCGAIPTGYLLIKIFKHQDIRDIGSGNIGSTNVRRAAGATFATTTQVIDILKGVIPVGIAIALSRHIEFGMDKMIVFSAVALVSILGHDFSPFLGFRGGKGVNTTSGAFLLLAPIPVISGVVVFYALRILTSIVSIRSLALGITIALMTEILGLPRAVVIASCIAAFLIVIRHIDNVRRLIRHHELK